MTLVIKKGIRLRNQLPADAEADAYIAAVEAADGQALEPGVKFAIKNFVLCCKQDGIWNAIKASCILAGARTLNGALVPLVGTAPTNFNFVAGDYNRKTGLVGNGSTKYLNSNRNNNADPQDSRHLSIWASTATATTTAYIGSISLIQAAPFTASQIINNNSNLNFSLNSTSGFQPVTANGGALGFIGSSRANSSSLQARINQVTHSIANASAAPNTFNSLVFARNLDGTATIHSNARLSFYSIGESLDLAKLDARVTDLMNALGAAIP